MTPEAQRIAIAEACGWKKVRIEKSSDGHEIYESLWVRGNPSFDYDTIQLSRDFALTLPDYLNDLNAMHEAVQVFTDKQKEFFTATLAGIVAKHDDLPEEGDYIGYIEWSARGCFDVYNATASQRREAFLRTLNLWDDSK